MPIFKFRVILFIPLFFCITVFAEVGSSTTSTVITQTTPETADTNGKTVTQSTTTTTTTTTNKNPIDDDIISAIYAKYAKEAALIGTKLTVSSENGVVTISGTVTAQSQADQAVLVAKSIGGVKDVRSLINVITNPNPPQPTNIPNY